jgi:hypothetical protein
MPVITPIDQAMGMSGEWRPAFRVVAPLVIAKDQHGRMVHCYRGALLGWLNDEQAAHFLRKGLVERVGDDAEPIPAPDIIAECIGALNSLGVPQKAGAPTARESLRNANRKFSNSVIAQAVKIRQATAKTSAADEKFEEIVI